MTKKNILLLILTLTLLGNIPAITATTTDKLEVSVINATGASIAPHEHLVYLTVKVWNKADEPIDTILSISPNRDHRLDDNKYWGNYEDSEKITISANELHVHIFSIVIPKSSNNGKHTWTLNISTGEELISKQMEIDLRFIQNKQIDSPTWQPNILMLKLPPGKSDVIALEANKSKTIIAVMVIAGDLERRNIYDVQLDTRLPDLFFSYPEKISVKMSEPASWNFDNQTFLPFTPIPLKLTANVPYSKHRNMYKTELQMEEKKTGLKAILPLHLVITTPTEIVGEINRNATIASEINKEITNVSNITNAPETVVNASAKEVITERTNKTEIIKTKEVEKEKEGRFEDLMEIKLQILVALILGLCCLGSYLRHKRK